VAKLLLKYGFCSSERELIGWKDAAGIDGKDKCCAYT